jgi:hypothetical protein
VVLMSCLLLEERAAARGFQEPQVFQAPDGGIDLRKFFGGVDSIHSLTPDYWQLPP